ncbi:MAG TPA: hypothetical protein VH107_14560 [Lacipirellulaceae bacterium]|jgi:hypothetical protein|nr:hypothetical protein [Lacipirellulaceae bacterium]
MNRACEWRRLAVSIRFWNFIPSVVAIVCCPICARATAYKAIILNSPGLKYAFATDSSGSSITGRGSAAAQGGDDHALFWSAANANPVDLNPTEFATSDAWTSAGGYSGGDGYGPATGGADHACCGKERRVMS